MTSCGPLGTISRMPQQFQQFLVPFCQGNCSICLKGFREWRGCYGRYRGQKQHMYLWSREQHTDSGGICYRRSCPMAAPRKLVTGHKNKGPAVTTYTASQHPWPSLSAATAQSSRIMTFTHSVFLSVAHESTCSWQNHLLDPQLQGSLGRSWNFLVSAAQTCMLERGWNVFPQSRF